jgi:hypothetical protein
LSKDKFEWEALGLLKRGLPAFPCGEVEKTESPDFLVHGSLSTIGIEITRLYHSAAEGGVSPQAVSEMHVRVAHRACELYSAVDGRPAVHVSVRMRCTLIGKRQVEILAREVADVVNANLPSPNCIELLRASSGRPGIPESVESIRISRSAAEGIAETFFSCGAGSAIPELSEIDIRRALDSKEAKYAEYRQRCEQAWLLIVMDLWESTTWYELESFSCTRLTTSFDRVFLLSDMHLELLEFRVSRPQRFDEAQVVRRGISPTTGTEK